MELANIIALVGELVALAASVAGIVVSISKVTDGQKCLMRTEMLRIYYNHLEEKSLRQFEYENFFCLYEAYKRLKGNSFIDKVAAEVKGWDIKKQ